MIMCQTTMSHTHELLRDSASYFVTFKYMSSEGSDKPVHPRYDTSIIVLTNCMTSRICDNDIIKWRLVHITCIFNFLNGLYNDFKKMFSKRTQSWL